MGVRGDLAAEAMCVGDDGAQFLLGVLRVLGIVAQRQDAAGGADLDDVSAVLDDLAHLVLHVFDAVSDADLGGMPLVGQQVVVAMSAGNAQRRTAGVDARTGHVARIDGVAQGDVSEFGGTDVADRGEARQQGDAGILGPD